MVPECPDCARKDAALDVGIIALTMLSKKGSIRRADREIAIQVMVEARNGVLFGPSDLPTGD